MWALVQGEPCKHSSRPPGLTPSSIWACELGNKLSSTGAEIDAFDISDLQFPAPAFRPANVHFHVHNSFQPYPEEFLGKFDVVHVRFMMCSVNDANARKLLSQLLTLMSTFCSSS